MKLSPVRDEEKELKEWLVGLLPDGMSRQEVADELSVSRKTITSLLNPNSTSFANGRTMLGYLRLAGALRDVPEAGPALSRLAAIEAKLEQQGAEMTDAVYALAAEVRAQAQSRDDGDPPAKQAQVDR